MHVNIGVGVKKGIQVFLVDAYLVGLEVAVLLPPLSGNVLMLLSTAGHVGTQNKKKGPVGNNTAKLLASSRFP